MIIEPEKLVFNAMCNSN